MAAGWPSAAGARGLARVAYPRFLEQEKRCPMLAGAGGVQAADCNLNGAKLQLSTAQGANRGTVRFSRRPP
jgi:hypothetical protein